MSDANKAVFISYAREDVGAARRIAEALRSFGLAVWFDQNELRGGEAWDAKLRHQIRTCTLFMPVISATTQARSEGYFRREWKLAVERTHDMAAGTPFLVPVAIDSTAESRAIVPEEFMRVQWTRLPGGLPSPPFIDQVKRLLETETAAEPELPRQGTRRQDATPTKTVRRGWLIMALGAVIAAAAIAFLALRKPVTAIGDKSIAVLPFANVSADSNDEYLSDGVTEEVGTALSKVTGLQVKVRTSSFAFKGKNDDIQKIGEQLRVSHVLGGSVTKTGSKLRITAKLISVANGDQLWADSYHREIADIFTVQSEVAQQVASALKVRLLGEDKQRLLQKPTENQEAYQSYLKGRFHLSRVTKEGFEQALFNFNEAIRLDDKFAKAYSGIADAYHQAEGWFVEDALVLSLGMKAAMTALALDGTAPEAHASLGFYYTSSWRWADAEASFMTALRLNPRYAHGHLGSGSLSMLTGQSEKGLNHLSRAHELEPGEPTFAAWLGWACVHLGRYEAATSFLNKALELDRKYWFAQEKVGLSFAFQGNYAEAIAWTEKAVEGSERNVEALSTLGWVHGRAGNSTKAQAILQELLTVKKPRTAPPWVLAFVYLGLDQNEDAIKQLQEGIRIRDPGMMFIGFDRRFDPLRQDTRFQEIMKTIGLAK